MKDIVRRCRVIQFAKVEARRHRHSKEGQSSVALVVDRVC